MNIPVHLSLPHTGVEGHRYGVILCTMQLPAVERGTFLGGGGQDEGENRVRFSDLISVQF